MTLLSIATRFAAVIIILSCSGTAYAGQTSALPSGSGLYVNYCGSCHGPQAKGDGPMASVLRVKPADLTTIATRSGGKFPSEAVFRSIDGRNPAMGHGGSMPVWGDTFLRSQGGASPDVVRARIDALVRYIETIQQKP